MKNLKAAQIVSNCPFFVVAIIMVRAKSSNQPVANYMRSQSLPSVIGSQVIPYFYILSSWRIFVDLQNWETVWFRPGSSTEGGGRLELNQKSQNVILEEAVQCSAVRCGGLYREVLTTDYCGRTRDVTEHHPVQPGSPGHPLYFLF